ncbi:MAG TPA: response regulator transcription factor [Gaiellaceae bacterium]|nr:response regulator transcription factor [Gaiellaceae bacterium]
MPDTAMPDSSSTILLVDDEDAIQQLLTYPLQRDGYRVVQARDGEEALARFAEETVDLVVLDIMLPRIDGLEVCRRLRATSTVPIIMLTARDDELDKVLGLELGADDYITKPFSIREFRSRVRALLRRAATPHHASRQDEVIDRGDLRVDLPRRAVEVRGKPVQLTFVEFELLALLAANPGVVLSRRQLLERIRGSADYREPRTIDVHVRHLREKIERAPHDPELILTVRGVGYRFREQ